MITYLYDLPVKCKGFILRDPYTDEEAIILNARLTNEANREAYIHELYHRLHGDLDIKEDVNTIENRAHQYGKAALNKKGDTANEGIS